MKQSIEKVIKYISITIAPLVLMPIAIGSIWMGILNIIYEGGFSSKFTTDFIESIVSFCVLVFLLIETGSKVEKGELSGIKYNRSVVEIVNIPLVILSAMSLLTFDKFPITSEVVGVLTLIIAVLGLCEFSSQEIKFTPKYFIDKIKRFF